MADYRVIVKPSADKALRKLPLKAQSRLVAAMRALAANPRPVGVVKMHGAGSQWRIRVGDYRLVYEIHDREITLYVLAIGHRREVYRGF